MQNNRKTINCPNARVIVGFYVTPQKFTIPRDLGQSMKPMHTSNQMQCFEVSCAMVGVNFVAETLKN
jgi:hypothetical protein